MKKSDFVITENRQIARDVYEMHLEGDVSHITAPGQFVNIKLNDRYLRRPISVCDIKGNTLIIIYKVAGKGTAEFSTMHSGMVLNILSGLGNGFDVSPSGDSPLLIGGGVGTPPLYYLAKALIEKGAAVSVVLGFNTIDEVFYADEFAALGCAVSVATADGSFGVRGFVTDILPSDYSYFYAVGPEPMLKAVYGATHTSGQMSFEERMGCGFGACMGCSCRTLTGYKRICREGPVMKKEELLWAD